MDVLRRMDFLLENFSRFYGDRDVLACLQKNILGVDIGNSPGTYLLVVCGGYDEHRGSRGEIE